MIAKPTVAQLLHGTFAGREHFTSEDILTELPGMRLRTAQSIICRYRGQHFEMIVSGIYRAIGNRPPDRKPPGRKKRPPVARIAKPVSKRGFSLIVDWLTKPINLPFSVDGWKK